MVRSIKDIGHVMGKQVIAESVESDAVLEKLREIGVDYAQGFAIGEPRPLGGAGSGHRGRSPRGLSPVPGAAPYKVAARPEHRHGVPALVVQY